jgi:hypothetical protein
MLRSHNPELAARVTLDAQGSLSIRNDSVSAYAHDSEHRYSSYAAAHHDDASQHGSAADSSVQQEQRRSSKRRTGSSRSHKKRAETAEMPHRLHVSERRRSARTGESITVV